MLIIVENNANICYDVQAETLEYIWPKMTVYGSETCRVISHCDTLFQKPMGLQHSQSKGHKGVPPASGSIFSSASL